MLRIVTLDGSAERTGREKHRGRGTGERDREQDGESAVARENNVKN